MNLCIKCNERLIKIKKRKLCRRCYTHIRINEKNKGTKYCCDSELKFIKNYFDHQDFIHHPTTLKLRAHLFPIGSNGKYYIHYTIYTPDFYDISRRAYIEVSATRCIFMNNKHKYDRVIQQYPLNLFEVRKPSGELLPKDENGYYIWV